jgi:acetyl-CoA C-acetyltransferase
MDEAYIVAAARTAGGRRGCRLAGVHPVDLGAAIIDALLARVGADPVLVEDVLFGCVSQIGEQSTNVARNVVLASRLLETTPATTIDRQCGSSQQALHFAAHTVASGAMDIVIAGGVESMSRVPMGSPVSLAAAQGMGDYKSPRVEARYPGRPFSQFTGAEMVAAKYGFDREQLDRFALESHHKAASAIAAGKFIQEIVPIDASGADGQVLRHEQDEGVRFDASLARMASVKPLREGGVITAANASQMCDGASGVMVVNRRGLKMLSAEPIARIVQTAVVGGDPVMMLDAPADATAQVLRRANLAMDDIDLFEVNEAFASIPLAWLQRTDADPERMNVHGGAIALGHPLGASGTKLMTTLLSALTVNGKRLGLQTMCEGGGMANATIVEKL